MGPDGPIPGGLDSNAWRVRLRERRLVHHQAVEQNSHVALLAAKTYRANGLLAAERPSPQRSEARPHVFERAEFRPLPPPLATRHQVVHRKEQSDCTHLIASRTKSLLLLGVLIIPRRFRWAA